MAAGDFFVRRWEALKNKQIWGRIGQIVLVLLGISFVTFALVMLSPGDPVRQMIAGNEDIVVSQALCFPVFRLAWKGCTGKLWIFIYG